MTRIASVLTFALAIPSAAFAQHEQHAAGNQLGTVSFETSCTPSVAADFNRGVALLHSFEFRDALASFNAVVNRAGARAPRRDADRGRQRSRGAPRVRGDDGEGARTIPWRLRCRASGEASGDREKARQLYQTLLNIARSSEAERPELQRARAFLKSA
jgi:hypothetical protein